MPSRDLVGSIRRVERPACLHRPERWRNGARVAVLAVALVCLNGCATARAVEPSARRRRMRRGACAAALAGVLNGLTACATAGPVELGQLDGGANLRATYTSPETPVLDARLVRQVNGSLELVAPPATEPFRVHLSDLGLLEVQRGRESGSAALTGAVFGGAAGLIGGMICLAKCGGADRPVLAPVIGIGIGSAVGAAAGVFRAPARWVEVRIR